MAFPSRYKGRAEAWMEKLVRTTRIDGDFEGWDPRVAYELADGSKWRLTKPRSTRLIRHMPRVKIWKNKKSIHFMEVEGIREKAEVTQVT
ncbi:MAG: hypothetical protein ACC661_08395 [Verrucomicrobiales bacterium]